MCKTLAAGTGRQQIATDLLRANAADVAVLSPQRRNPTSGRVKYAMRHKSIPTLLRGTMGIFVACVLAVPVAVSVTEEQPVVPLLTQAR